MRLGFLYPSPREGAALIICHCHRVTASEARAACSGPDADWRSVVKATKAATECGGCMRSLRKTVEAALSGSAGVAQTVTHAG
jgi:bacterioferritin-associated ferredoxin